jgi:hypothetical protein
VIVEADFQRFYGLDPLELGWGRFCRLLRGLPPESGLLAALAQDQADASAAEDARVARVAFALEHGELGG